jgi:hypothetical protein
MSSLLLLLLLIQIKHLVIDWCWQPEYEWKNKGTYGHLGGLSHAAKNAIGTAFVFCFFVPQVAWLVLLIDFIAHYHIDWAKMNINRIKGWGPTTHDQFWMLTGFDQFLHQITYLLLVFLFV